MIVQNYLPFCLLCYCQVRDLVPESQAYMDLLAFERKLDATIMRKRMDIQEALKRPMKVTMSYFFNWLGLLTCGTVLWHANLDECTSFQTLICGTGHDQFIWWHHCIFSLVSAAKEKAPYLPDHQLPFTKAWCRCECYIWHIPLRELCAWEAPISSSLASSCSIAQGRS